MAKQVKENTQSLQRKTLTEVWEERWPGMDVRRIHTSGVGSEEAMERCLNSDFDILPLPDDRIERIKLTGSATRYILMGRPLKMLKAEREASAKRRPKDIDIEELNDD